MCNLYGMTRARSELVGFVNAIFDRNNNQPPNPGIFPDYSAPIVVYGESGLREMRDARWGLPSPIFALQGRSVDRGVTNVRNTRSPHWRRWLAPEFRCLVPFTSFAEPADANRSENVWFALGQDRRLGWFAGLWVPGWRSVRKLREGEVTADLFGFLTTEPNADVGPIHSRAMPVVLASEADRDLWLSGAPWPDVAALQHPLPGGELQIVARGLGLKEEPT
ncbi:MAG TPA: SOS response-associated peptidase [Caulobacteraceae bacterium]|jgi:putative SOS response-associated peptidase YedK